MRNDSDITRYFHILLAVSLLFVFCILSAAPALAATETFAPNEIALGPDGNVYTYAWSDGATHIYVFAPDGTMVNILDGQARELAFDDAGNLYVLDRTTSKTGQPTIDNITRRDTSGNVTVLWCNVNESRRDVICMAVAPGGDVYFITVHANENQSAKAGESVYIREIDAIDSDGKLRVILTTNTTLPYAGFGTLAIDRDGTIYASGASNRINVIAPNGTMWTIGKPGSANGTFLGVTEVAIGRDGYLYVCEAGNRRIQKLTTDGTYVAKWSGCGPDPFLGHCELAIDENGRVYVADLDNRRIVWLTPEYMYGTDEAENMKGQGVTWGTVRAGTNYTTLMLE